jgi:hypothetical protein
MNPEVTERIAGVRGQLDLHGLSAELGSDGVFGWVGQAIETHRAVASSGRSSRTDTADDGPRPSP